MRGAERQRVVIWGCRKKQRRQREIEGAREVQRGNWARERGQREGLQRGEERGVQRGV